MSAVANPFNVLQSSDNLDVTPFSLQDYGALSNDGLAAPSLDTPMGVDPFSGINLFSGDPSAPSLTVLQPDASDGSNLYNDGLLPLTNPNPIDTKVIAASQYGGVSFEPDGNLPLTPPNTSLSTKLGSPTIAAPNANPMPMGASLWASLFGTASAVLGAPKAGTAGAQGSSSKNGGLAGIKAAPKTALSNPYSGTTVALVIGVVAALIGMVLWSFSGAR